MNTKIRSLSLKAMTALALLQSNPLTASNLIATNIVSTDSGTLALPRNYKHCNVSQQMENYRKIHDAALESYKNVEYLKSKTIPGLFDVLTNAFALINDHILDDTTRGSDQKEKYLSVLKDLWVRAKKSPDTLTSSIFQGFNKNLAYIIDCYKEQKDISINGVMSSNPLAFPDWSEHFSKNLQAFKHKIDESCGDPEAKKRYINKFTDIENYMKDKISDSNFKLYGIRSTSTAFKTLEDDYKNRKIEPRDLLFFPRQDEDPNISDILFIIYGLPKPGKARNISPSHFVEQCLNENYSSYVSFFDILSKPKDKWNATKENRPTHKDPHWSLENGTERMLEHDLAHIRRQIWYLKEVTALEYLKVAFTIQKKLKDQNKNNDATILMDGLFMIIHERPDVVMDGMANPEVREDGKSFKFFEAIASKFKKTIMTYDRNDRSYSGLSLYGSQTYKQENRDWEFILKDKYAESDGSIKPVHDENGTFLPIEYDVGQKKITRPFNNDPNRTEKMINTLSQGYARFWTYFLSIIEKNSNE